MLTYHGLPELVWLAARDEAEYRPDGFAVEGFIHTSPDPASLADALNRHAAADSRRYVALVIDLDRVKAPWRSVRHPGLDVAFPHIHGPLNRDAVLAVVPVPRGENGGFLPPDPFTCA
ncbi:MAG TPA: DUF952 domain-containing protein [Dehalococcoidia bacterium]|nr:DUF952 domain-containing protein [Dehalococcoidia bacterium]